MDHSSGNMEDTDAVGDLNCGSLAQEVSKKKKNVSKWSRNNSYGILAKNMAAFCHHPKSLPKAKMKSFRLMAL